MPREPTVDELKSLIASQTENLALTRERLRLRLAKELGELNELRNLSHREQEIIPMIRGGKSNKEIAFYLHISERTVKFHVSRILQKFDVRSRTDLILLAT